MPAGHASRVTSLQRRANARARVDQRGLGVPALVEASASRVSPPWEVSDELWAHIEPLLPLRERRFRNPGRKRLPDRDALCGILFVLSTGTAWMRLPQELGYGSGFTSWRRLEEWRRAGVWDKLQQLLRSELGSAAEIDWSRSRAYDGPARGNRRGARARTRPSS
jgi:transposase